MLRKLFLAGMVLVTLVAFTGCSSVYKTMREPNVRVELNMENFELSGQVSAEATSTKILGIDWQRLIHSESGSIEGSAMAINFAAIPVVGNFVVDMTSNYALYQLMMNNPGYDVVFYPQFETVVEKPIIGIGFFQKVTTVKVTARLGKLKK
ncbi:MAG: hypothetical protein ACOYXB_03560 [Bacteroidota bacterium]